MRSKLTLFLLITVLISSMSFAQSVIVKDYTITFNGVTNDYQNNRSTWSYTVSTIGSAKDLSHWVVGLCQDHNVLNSHGLWSVPTNGDPTTGVYGIKWDDGLATGNTQEYTFTLEGIYDITDVKVAVKTGGKEKVGVAMLAGPSCEVEVNNASLGDRVWLDKDKDGIQDGDEKGVKNVIVKLYDCSDNFIKSATTDEDGYYLFDNLTPGDYYVLFELPSGYVFTSKNSASYETDSDADQTTGKTECTTLDPGENDMTWDAGIYEEEIPDPCANDFTLDWDGDETLCEFDQIYVEVDANISLIPNPSKATVKAYSWTANGWDTTSYSVNNNKELKLTGYWPGVNPGDTLVEIKFYIEVFDCDQNKLGETKSFTVKWDSTVCPPPADEKPDIKVEKSVNSNTAEDTDEVEYTIVVTNLGPGNATNVKVSDQLPAGLDFVSATDANFNSATGIWTIPALADGESKSLTITVKVNSASLNTSAFNLGVAKDYDLFVFEDMTVNTGDVEGKTAVGRDLTINGGYSFGDKLVKSNNGDVLIVGRNLTVNSNGGRVYKGNAVYGSSTNLPKLSFSIDGELRKDNVIDFTAAKNYFVTLSDQLKNRTSNGSAVYDGWTLTLTGTDPAINVFDVNGDDFAQMTGLKIDVPSGSVVLVNISGAVINDWSGGLEIVGADPTDPSPYQSQNILYNFYEATELHVNATSPKGTILAPYATLYNQGGFFDGQVIIKSVAKALQFNHHLFVGNIPGDKEIINVASLSSLDQEDPNNSNNSSVASLTLTTTVADNSSNDEGEWNVQAAVGPAEIVWTICKDNNGNQFIGTWGGNIYKFVNGDYNLLNPGMGVAYVWSIIKDDAGNLYAATEKGIYTSNNSGDSWISSPLTSNPMETVDVRAIAFSPDGTLYAGTWGRGLYKFNGATWEAIKILPEFDFNNQPAVHGLTFTSNGDMFVGTFNVGMYKLANGSTEFVKLNTGYEYIWTLHTAVDDILFAGTYGGGVLMSYDNGANWIKRNEGLVNHYIYAIQSNGTDAFISSWAAGVYKLQIYGGEVLLNKGGNGTLDIDWKQYGLNGVSISTLFADNDGSIYAGTNEGTVYKFTPSTTAVEEIDDTPQSFELRQNYPNPFNPTTEIEFSIAEQGNYKIEIYNVLGQKVKTLVTEELEPGRYKTKFDASSYASGVYLYILSGNQVKITKKMMLIK